jgi:hypothetical protein
MPRSEWALTIFLVTFRMFLAFLLAASCPIPRRGLAAVQPADRLSNLLFQLLDIRAFVGAVSVVALGRVV